jgi:hypothetical protein
MKRFIALTILAALFAPAIACSQKASASRALEDATMKRLIRKYREDAPGHNRLIEARERAQITDICNVHHIRMTRRIVPVVGLVVFGDAGEDSPTGLRLYPNAFLYAFLYALPYKIGNPDPQPERTASKLCVQPAEK